MRKCFYQIHVDNSVCLLFVWKTMFSLDIYVILVFYVLLVASRAIHLEKRGPKEINIRLAATSDESFGRVEIQDASNSSSPWGTVCDDQWNNQAASVVCRQLGYKWGEKVTGLMSAMWRRQRDSPPVDNTGVPIFLDDVSCEGEENSLVDCVHSGWGIHDCTHSEDAGVICHNVTVRLQAPTDDGSVGNVQIMYRYKWAEVCDENWNNISASLVCQDLGYVDGIAMCCSAFGASSFIDLDYSITFNCSENDMSLDACKNKTFFDQCDLFNRASVICYNTKIQEVDQDFQIRLAAGEEYWGRVEIRHLGVWGQICVKVWDDTAANLICRQLDLGFKGGHSLGASVNSKLPVWLSSVTCAGNETSIENCAKSPWGEPADYGCRAAFVLCYKKSGVAYDIVDSDLPRQGRLQLTFEGVPGSLGTEEWSDNDAHIVCRQMGYASGVTVEPVTGVQPYYLNKLICYSQEIKSILQCGNTGWGTNRTGLSESAYLKCFNHVRLHNGGVSSGIVEVYDGQRWLGLCDLGFTKELAQLACREISHTDNGEILQTGAYGSYYRYVGRPYLNCPANATSIAECLYDKQVKCSGFIYNYVSVSCYNGTDQKGNRIGFNPCLAQSEFDLSQNQSRTRLDGFLRSYLIRIYNASRSVYEFVEKSAPGNMLVLAVTTGRTGFNPFDEELLHHVITSMKLTPNKYPTFFWRNEVYGDIRFDLLGNLGVGYGPMMVSHKHQFGEICAAGWGDEEASVFCRSLGSHYVGGVAVYYQGTPHVPMLLSEVTCLGNESKIAECKTDERFPCHVTLRAGSICYKQSAPTVKLVDGGKNFGRVVIEVDGLMGLVLDNSWSDEEAAVVCREISKDYVGGEVYSNLSKPTSGDVYLSDINCQGYETSILHCDNGGWKVAEKANDSQAVGVYCFQNARVYGGVVSTNLMMGRVQIRSIPTAFNIETDNWVNICADEFDQVDADVVCRQMGFDVAEILVPGFLHINTESIYYTNMTCKEGGTNVLKDCKFNQGSCMYSSHNFANVLCRKNDLLAKTSFHIEHGYHGMVYAERYGINGTVCIDGWDDRDATVICRGNGYKGGVVLGGPPIYARPDPVWFTNVSCTNESSFSDCPMSLDVPVGCSRNLRAAGVLCYNGSGIQIELENERNDSHYGKVRIKYDDKPGYICDIRNVGLEEQVCKELGYLVGDVRLIWNDGSTPDFGFDVYLSEVDCKDGGPYDSVLACVNKGWGQKNPRCLHSAGVTCKTNVVTKEAENYGAVHVWVENRYSLVCSDDFDDADATVVCRRMGFPYGKSLCCSAFGFFDDMIEISQVTCTGNEMDINDCGLTRGMKSCASGDYASVVCSLEEPLQVYFSSVGSNVTNGSNSGVGPVRINYFNQEGGMCDVGFDDRDASVICKSLAFADGFAYRYFVTFQKTTSYLRWLKAPNCTGEETHLGQCPGFQLGDVRGCSVSSVAAVFCHMEKEQAGFEVRLSNSNHPAEGFVEVKVNGTWGSICGGRSEYLSRISSVVCRQLGFKDGYDVAFPTFPSLNGTVWLDTVICKGNESSIKECVLSGFESEMASHCSSHMYDVAVKCYTDVRLSGFPIPNYGMVKVLTENSWMSVCDVGFDDVDARIVCRSLGYKDGKAQCCSSLGLKMTRFSPIGVSNVSCNGTEASFTECQKSFGNATCESGLYASVICTDESPPAEDLKVKLKDGLYYGDVQVTRYGVFGSVCDDGWTDTEATVVCQSMGFVSGYATNGTNTGVDPMILTSVSCLGNETKISDCKYPPLNKGHNCNDRNTRAAALCSMDTEKIRYRVADMFNERGRAEIYFNGRWGTICDTYWDDKDADIFCKQAGYLFGEATVLMPAGSFDMPIWMTRVGCAGTETDFLQCRASWDKNLTSRCSHFEDAGVRCYSTARLFRGDYMTKRTNGIVEIYVAPSDPVIIKTPWYTVCADTFTDKEADVVCRSFGHQHGMSLCCGPYGYSTIPMTKLRPKCNGTENQISECEQVWNDTKCSKQNYASVACYNGTRPVNEYNLDLKGSLKYTGQVVVNYLGVPGSVCWTGWTDEDARVVCRELGFKNGSAYYHYRSSFIYLDYNGPYWTGDVRCVGNETRLSDCLHTGFGNVTECEDRGHYAGVVCFDDTEIAFRISGGNDQYGRVEFSYDNQWHPFCGQSWGHEEADVMCRQLGYVTGDTYSGQYNDIALGIPYTIDFRCTGSEQNLTYCPHEGIDEASTCKDDKDIVGVFCHTSVKLSGKAGGNIGSGTVLYYQTNAWLSVCDDGFDDVTAKVVCQELGYVDGLAICCSAYGKVHEDLMTNYTLHCTGQETSVEQCLQNKTCNSSHYASAVCFKTFDAAHDDSYTFKIAKQEKGQVQVTHYGVTGRICSRGWDDRDAVVFCGTQGFDHGLSYQHSESNVLQEVRGPYWLSGFNCTGDEESLLDCQFMDRLKLGDCSGNDIASVLCYNESGIQYRMADGGDHYGRVEISVGGRWGTICDSFWDEREAGIFCRQMNFTDGEPVGRAHFGEGTGPIWLSHLECKGTEKKLHECPHRGFANEFSFDWWFPLPCETHSDDAGVFCYKSVRLSNGPNSKAGGLEMYHNGDWFTVCDTDFGLVEAKVACRSLKTQYIDARAIPGSAYGARSKPLMFSHVNCSGEENDMDHCKMEINTTCSSGHYVSIECSEEEIVDSGFETRLSTDSLAGRFHGILEVRIDGIWGRVCLHNFDDTDASVACRQLGFDGGVAYLHIMKNDRPVLMRDVNCTGNETSLDQCASEKFSPDLSHCNYGSNDAGVVCYYVTDGIGFEYRLVGGADRSAGRVEIGYAGTWGAVCSWSWQSADARVLCRSIGYTDGIVNYVDEGPPLPLIRPWVSGFFCLGNESSPLTCLNTGFNSSFLADLCIGRKELGAYTRCFNTSVAPTEIRLMDGPNNYTGRVEVYVSGANEWGTICDDHWDDFDAHVVCRQLGYFGGSARRKAEYGSGTGPIWFDNMKCGGSEKTIFECEHRGIGTHNCNHKEDVGVICQEHPVPLSTATSKSASRLSTTTTVDSVKEKPTATEPSTKISRKTEKPIQTTSTIPSRTVTRKKETYSPTTVQATTHIVTSLPETLNTTVEHATSKLHLETTEQQINIVTSLPETLKTTVERVTTKIHQETTEQQTTERTLQQKTTQQHSTQQHTEQQTTQKHKTQQQTTKHQTTQQETKEQKTTQQFTTERNIPTSLSTERPESTTILQTITTVFSSTNITETFQRALHARANMAAAIAIPLCLILIIIVIIIAVVIARKRMKRHRYRRELFDDSVISQDQDGNISATNQIYDLDLRSSNSNNSVDAEKVNLNRNGKASYSRGPNDNDELQSSAFSNPLYDASKNLDSPDMENLDFQLALQEDIHFKNSSQSYS